MFTTFLICAVFLMGGIFLILRKARRKADLLRAKHVYAGSFRPTDETLRSLAKSSPSGVGPSGGSRRAPSSETSRSTSESFDTTSVFFASGAFSSSDDRCDSGPSSWSGGDSGSSSSCGDSGGSYSSD